MNNKIFVTQPLLPAMEDYITEIKDIWATKWLTNMGAKHNDFFGITINKNGYYKNLKLGANAPHIQSYFISVSKNIFQKKFFIDFINSIKKQKNKRKIIYNYEQGLSRIITSKGFDMYSYYPTRDNDNKYPDPYFYYLGQNSDFDEEHIFFKKCLVNHCSKNNTNNYTNIKG